MNWTGGNLSRVSKGTNKSSVQRQKGYFAKLRTKLQDSTTKGDESITKALAQLFSGQKAIPQLIDGKQSYHGDLTTVQTPLQCFRSRSVRYTIASHASTSVSGGRGELVASPLPEHCQSDDSKRQHLGFSIDIERRRLLEGHDWLGLALTKPLGSKHTNIRKKHVGKRKKLQTNPRLQARSPMHQPLQPCILPVEAGSMYNKEPDREVILVKAGSHVLLSDGSSSVELDLCNIEHSRVKVNTSTKSPYGIGFASYYPDMGAGAKTARRQVAFSGDNCCPGESASILHYRVSTGARTNSPYLENDPGVSSASIGLSNTQNKSYNGLLYRDVTSETRYAEYADPMRPRYFDNACISTSASVPSPPSNAVPVASYGRISSPVPDDKEERRVVPQIHSDNVVEGGEEVSRRLTSIGLDCKSDHRSSPDGRVGMYTWDYTLRDHRKPAQSSSYPATTPPSRKEWSNLHTRLETSSRSSTRSRHPSMHDVKGIATSEDFPRQIRPQLQDRSTDLWERFIFGSSIQD